MTGWRDIFIGPLRYWLLWPAIVAVLYLCGQQVMHVRHFVPFIFVVLALAAAAVLFVLATYRPGERVTREPIADDD